MQMNFSNTSRSVVTNLMAVTLFLVLMYCMTQSWRMVGGDSVVADFHQDTGLLTVPPFQLHLVLESYRKHLSTMQRTIPHLWLDLLVNMILD